MCWFRIRTGWTGENWVTLRGTAFSVKPPSVAERKHWGGGSPFTDTRQTSLSRWAASSHPCTRPSCILYHSCRPFRPLESSSPRSKDRCAGIPCAGGKHDLSGVWKGPQEERGAFEGSLVRAQSGWMPRGIWQFLGCFCRAAISPSSPSIPWSLPLTPPLPNGFLTAFFWGERYSYSP